jgi:predicted O-methyltransferase YrrM
VRWSRAFESIGRGVFTLSPAMVYLALRGKRWQRVGSESSRIASSELGNCLQEKEVLTALGVDAPPQLLIDVRKCSIGLPDLVGLLQCAKASGAARVFEFGTNTGGTTWHLAANLPPGAQVHTLDLDTMLPRAGSLSESSLATCRPTEELLGREFRGTPEASKIVQHIGDSRQFDTTPLEGSFDLVFIDAGHTYELVRNDTAAALRLVKPGGIIAWHDYFVFHPDYGVRVLLHELRDKGVQLNRYPEGLAAYCIVSSTEWVSAKQDVLSAPAVHYAEG